MEKKVLTLLKDAFLRIIERVFSIYTVFFLLILSISFKTIFRKFYFHHIDKYVPVFVNDLILLCVSIIIILLLIFWLIKKISIRRNKKKEDDELKNTVNNLDIYEKYIILYFHKKKVNSIEFNILDTHVIRLLSHKILTKIGPLCQYPGMSVSSFELNVEAKRFFNFNLLESELKIDLDDLEQKLTDLSIIFPETFDSEY